MLCPSLYERILKHWRTMRALIIATAWVDVHGHERYDSDGGDSEGDGDGGGDDDDASCGLRS